MSAEIGAPDQDPRYVPPAKVAVQMLAVIFLTTLSLAVVSGIRAEERKPGETAGSPKPVKQPVDFSHKRHAEMGLQCGICHPVAGPGDQAGIPQTARCLNCHQGKDSLKPAFRSLFEHAQEKRPIAWARIYLLPDFVFFSHRIHLDAGAGCTACHGAVATRDQLWKEREISMKSCVACHKSSQASESCTLCHELNQ